MSWAPVALSDRTAQPPEETPGTRIAEAGGGAAATGNVRMSSTGSMGGQ